MIHGFNAMGALVTRLLPTVNTHEDEKIIMISLPSDTGGVGGWRGGVPKILIVRPH